MTSLLDENGLSAAFGSTGWQSLSVLTSCPSTNAELAGRARAGAPHGSVLVTADQTAGRGRLDRSWVAPADTAVATSVLVRPTAGVAEWGWLSLLVGIAVVDGLRTVTDLDAALKWPNDVLIGERKICGILTEVVLTAPPAAVLGFGINIALDAYQLPVPTATSVRLAGSAASATEVVTGVLAALHTWYRRWAEGESLRAPYRERCLTLGRAVRLELPTGVVEGVAEDIDPAGCLIVRTPTGAQTFTAGDVVHLRPADQPSSFASG